MSEDVSAQSTAASLFVPKTALEQALSKSKQIYFFEKKKEFQLKKTVQWDVLASCSSTHFITAYLLSVLFSTCR